MKTCLILFVLFFFWLLSPICLVNQHNQISENHFSLGISLAEAQSNASTTSTQKGTPVLTGEELGINGMRATLYNIMTGFGSIFSYIGGWFLDVSVSVFTVNFKQTSDNMGLTAAVAGLWTIIRDLFNLLFVFGLIWIGFQTILDIGGSDAKRNLGFLIAAALLINFSLYISQVVVDFSSVASYQISQLMSSPYKTDNILGVEVAGIADVFAQAVSIENFQKNSQNAANQMGIKKDSSDGYDTWSAAFTLGFVVMVMLIILGFVFAAGAVILFTRFIALTLLMIFSPIMFLGLVLPSFKSKSKDWWKYFFNQALVGPAYLFMLYISLTALKQMIEANPKDVSLSLILLNFTIVTAFIVASLMVAKQLGAFGASQAINIGDGLRKRAQTYAGIAAGGATFGLGAAGMRSLIGKRAQKYADSDSLKDAASRGGLRGWTARRALNTARYAGDASFDARKVSGMGKALGIGEGSKGGYKTKRDELIKKEQTFAKSLGEVNDDDQTVVKLNQVADRTEAEIKTLKREKSLKTNKKDQVEIQDEIDKKESLLKDQRERAKQEKYRRQIGSTYQSQNITGYTSMLEEAEEELKKLKMEFKESTTDNEDERLTKAIREKKKEIKEHEKELRKYTSGYASVVENSPWYKNIFTGTNRNKNVAAGKALRDEYEKKVKKTKDDERIDGLGERIEKSVKNKD